jgi:hypothetical protein
MTESKNATAIIASSQSEEISIINDFQMEELEERFEMGGWVNFVVNGLCQPQS